MSKTSGNEYFDLNSEHNWQNKNDTKKLKRSYLQPRPDFAGDCKRKKINIAMLQNGNICESLKDGKYRLVIINTCGFNSIAQLFAAACIHPVFYDYLTNSAADMFRFMKNFIEKGPTKSIYRQRATILRKIGYFVSKNAFNVITVDALSNVCNLCEYLLSEEPSCTLQKRCTNCKKTITNDMNLISLDFQTIASHGYSIIAQVIDGFINNNYRECRQCKKSVELSANYRSHLLIECVQDKNVAVTLETFPKILKLDNESFSLIGVVHFISGRNISAVGHYTTYALYGDTWILFDDSAKTNRSFTEDITVNPEVCLYIKL